MITIAAVWGSTILFGLVHSLLASLWFKRRLGMKPVRYRLLYVVMSTLWLILWMLWLHSLPQQMIYDLEGWGRYLLWLLQLMALLMLMLSLLPMDGAAFLGLRPFPNEGESFVEQGIYRYLRHPMYSGLMLLLLASPWQSQVSLNFALAISLYLVIGARLVERRMELLHPEYKDYRRRIPPFLPRLNRIGCGSDESTDSDYL